MFFILNVPVNIVHAKTLTLCILEVMLLFCSFATKGINSLVWCTVESKSCVFSEYEI